MKQLNHKGGHMLKFLAAFGISLLISVQSFGQVYTNRELGKVSSDSLKAKEYPYVLPIWGKKAAQKGYQLPYSAGISVNYLWQESGLIIDNLQVGFNNGPMYDLDEVIRFDNVLAEASGVNIRPDIWLFPFLNVYGLFVKAKTSTTIDAGLWVPDAENNWSEVTTFSSKAEFDATSIGFGLTPTMGISGIWMALDMNCLWTDVSALNDPVFTFVFAPRFGKTFNFKKPGRNIAVWVGGFRVKFSSSTNGSLNLSEVLPLDGLQGKVDEGFQRVDEAWKKVDEWWNALTPAEQLDPANVARYDVATRAIESADNLLTGVDGALSNAETATVQYSLDKYLESMWSLVVGSQLQLSKNWMVRAEVGFLGERAQFIAGLQYRFGL
jgi:hypothetical protein